MYPVRTRESDDEGDAQKSSDAGSDVSDNLTDPPPASDHDGLQEGMLPRDLPKRTTFYDSVAERQMTQTDAKLFYQRSKIDLRSGTGAWSQSTPQGSPVIHSASQPPTEYGADSLILEHDGGQIATPPTNLAMRRVADQEG